MIPVDARTINKALFVSGFAEITLMDELEVGLPLGISGKNPTVGLPILLLVGKTTAATVVSGRGEGCAMVGVGVAAIATTSETG